MLKAAIPRRDGGNRTAPPVGIFKSRLEITFSDAE